MNEITPNGVTVLQPPVKAWSYSRLHDFERCELACYLKHALKIPDPSPRTAADRGTKIHESAELFVKGEGPMIPEMEKYRDDFDALKNLYQEGKVSVEGDWAFTQDWQPTEWNNDNAWARIKLDVSVCLTPEHYRVIDHKSGKKWGNEINHSMQCQLYELATFMKYPEAKLITSELWYLDQPRNQQTVRVVERDQLQQTLPSWDKRAKSLTNAVVFRPKPNAFNCRFCPYKPSGTGHCPVGVD